MNEKNFFLAIACASGGFKVAFVQGVLSAFEQSHIRADAYAASSGSVMPAAWAAIGQVNELGIDYWFAGLELLNTGSSLSETLKEGIDRFGETIRHRLFLLSKPTFIIAATSVVTSEAAAQTQGKQSKRLGRQLLLSAAKKDSSWVDKHLRLNLFSNSNSCNTLALTPNNFDEVTYASSRMIHAWDIPAWISGKPYIDASYTCICPALEMVEQGYQQVIAILTESENSYQDMFQQKDISTNSQEASIHIIKPDMNTEELGVSFTKADPEGLLAVYKHGQEKGQQFLEKYERCLN